ncbi:MAG: insulinase family protein [Gemmiger sp.]|nr:insulinase family protein [Gemmiger sp.]
MERKKLAEGVFITTLDAEKFNRCRIAIHLRYTPLRQSATDAAVLPLVLERGNAACPDMTQLSRTLARLYGADLGVDLGAAGCDRVLSADICGIKDQFALAGENLSAEYADLVFGTVFEPYLVDGRFDPEAVAIEKETLARRLQSEFNDKRRYCVRQARRRFYGDSPAGIELGGYLKELPAVTPATLKAEYDRILATAAIDVMVQGADADRVADKLLERLQTVNRAPQPLSPLMAMPRTAPQRYTERVPALTQAKLCMLFTRGNTAEIPTLATLRLAMGVFGGTVTSRLFRNVREKQSLCYYCGSTALRATGVMMVDSGVEPGGEARAEQAILKELQSLQTALVTPEELEDCRRALLSGFDAVYDTLAGTESWYYQQITRDEALAPPEYEKVLTQAVTRRQVQQVLQGYSYSVCYAVTATEGEGEAADEKL